MNVEEFINNNGKKEIPNPNYNPKSKKRRGSPTITVDDITPTPNPLVNVAKKDLENQQYIDSKETEKYSRFGLTWNPKDAQNGNLDIQLADAQSNWSKLFNALGQTVVSEIGLGTVEGFANLFDFVSSNILGITEADYQNPVSELMVKWQDVINNEVMPIYTDPNLNIQNGGLKDFGWWMKGIPNFASSLTMLIPARAVSGGLKLAGKAAKVDRLASKASKYVNGAKKVEKGKELNALQRAMNNPIGREKIKLGVENTFDSVLMRTMENYQESSETYKQAEDIANEKFSNMSDEEFTEWVDANRGMFDENTDLSDRSKVAKAIAKKSADRTFAMDFSNVIFDIIQLHGLRNIGKGPRELGKRGGGAKVQAEQRKSIAELAEFGGETGAVEKATLKGFKKFTTNAKAFVGHNAKIAAEESTEGIEEAVNYIAQQEGISYGKALLDGKDDEYKIVNLPSILQPIPGMLNVINTWNRLQNPLGDYIKDAELQESAFWGFLGGLAFGVGGSFYNRVQRARDVKKLEKELTFIDPRTKEKVNLNDNEKSFIELLELPEQQAAKAAISKRGVRLGQLSQEIEEIRKGNDIFAEKDADGKYQNTLVTDEQKEIAINRAISNYQSDLVLDAINSGTYDMLLAYWKSDGSKRAMKKLFSTDENNQISDTEVNNYINDFVTQAENIKNLNDRVAEKVMSQIEVLNAGANDNEKISLRYAQALSKKKLNRFLEADIIDKEMKALDESIIDAENWEQTIDKDFANTKLEARQVTRLRSLIDLYSMLETQKKEIQNSKANDWNSVRQVDNINRQQKVIIDQLKETPIIGTSNMAGEAAVASALMRSDKMRSIDRGNGLEYVYDNSLLARKDEEIIEELSKIFDKKYDNEDETKVIIQNANKFIQQSRFKSDDKNELKNKNPELWNKYHRYESLNLTKQMILADADLSRKSIEEDIDLMHNQYNSARKKIMFEATDNIINFVKNLVDNKELYSGEEFINGFVVPMYKGDIQSARDYLNSIKIKEEDANKLINSINLINFGNRSNKNIFDYLTNVLQRVQQAKEQSGDDISDEELEPEPLEEDDVLEEDEQGGETGENSSTFENGSESTQNQGSNITSQTSDNSNTGQNTDTEGQSELETTEIKPQPIITTDNTKPNNNNALKSVILDLIFNELDNIEDIKQSDIKERIINQLTNDISNLAINISSDTIKQHINEVINTIEESINTVNENDSEVKQKAAALLAYANASRGEEIYTPNFISSFGNAIDEFFKLYGKIVYVGKSENGKQIVSMRDVLLCCNRLSKNIDSGMASSLYNLILSYVTSNEGSKKYTINDIGLGKDELLKLSGLTDKELRDLQNKSNEDLQVERVDIASQINMFKENPENVNSVKFFNTLDNLNIGDKLDIDVEYNNNKPRIVFKKDDVILGVMPIPSMINDKFVVINNGWIHDISLDKNNNIVSNCKNVIDSILFGTTPANEEIINILNSYNLSSTPQAKTYNKTLLKKFENNSIIANVIKNEIAKRKAYTDKHGKNISAAPNQILFVNDKTNTVDTDRVLDFLARLYRYASLNARSLDPIANQKYIKDTVTQWFKNRYTTYDRITTFASKYKGEGAQSEVIDVNDGEIIKMYQNENTLVDNYETLPYGKDVIVDRAKSRISIIDDTNTAITSGFGNESTNYSKGNTYLTVYDRNGKSHRVRAIGTKIDGREKDSAKNIMKAAGSYVIKCIKELNENLGSTNNITNTIKNLENIFVTESNSTSLFRGLGSNILISRFSTKERGQGYDGIEITLINKNNVNSKISLKIYTITAYKNALGVALKKDNTYIPIGKHKEDNIIQAELKSKYVDSSTNSSPDITEKDVFKALERALGIYIFPKCQINISLPLIKSDNTKQQVGGLFKRTDTGISLQIPQEDGSTFNIDSNSYNDFLIDNDLIKVNLNKINGKNFIRRGINQKQNQILYVSLPNLDTQTSNVSDTANDSRDYVDITSDKDLRDKVKDIFENNKVNSTEEILDVVLGQGTLEQFKQSFSTEEEAEEMIHSIFPGNVTYDPEINWYDPKTGDYKGANAYTKGAHTTWPYSTWSDDGSRMITKTIKSNQHVMIGSLLLNNLSHIDINKRKEAIRKLIHEQLHTVFQQNPVRLKELIKISTEVHTICTNTLEKQLKTETDDKKLAYLKNVDKNIKSALPNYSGNKLYEEFLIESLTNKVIFDYLNTIEVENETKTEKKSLISRIIEAIAKFFGLTIKDNTLLMKEFNALASLVDSQTPVEKSKKNIDENERSESLNNIEGEVGDDITANQVDFKHSKGFEETSKVIDDYIKWSNEHTSRDDNHVYHYLDGDNETPIDMSVTRYYNQLHPENNDLDSDEWNFAGGLGNSIDAITRDFYLNGEKYVRTTAYPNINTKRKNYIISDLRRFTEYLNKQYPKGYKVITNEFTLLAQVNTSDGIKSIAGTMDMLVIDNEGNLHIYDMKNKRRANMTKEDKDRYTFQLNVYRQMLEQMFPQFKGKIKDNHLIWFTQDYPTPNAKLKYEKDVNSDEVNVRDLNTGNLTPIYLFKEWRTPRFDDKIDKSIKELEYKDELENLSSYNISSNVPQNEKVDDGPGLDINYDEDEDEDEYKTNASVGEELNDIEYTATRIINKDAFKNSLPLNLQEKFIEYVDNGEIKLICTNN